MTAPMWDALLRLVEKPGHSFIKLQTLRALDRRGLLSIAGDANELGYSVASAYQAGRYSMNEQGDQGGFKS